MKAKDILVLWNWVYEFSINSYSACQGTFVPQAVNESVPRLITMLRHLWEDKVVTGE